jgi:hypothetical protein
MEEQAVPSRRRCGAVAAYYLTVEAHPEFRERQRELEDATAERKGRLPSVGLTMHDT